MAVLVTDGNQRSTLAVVRSLGRQGIEVVAGEAAPESLAGSSRFAAGREVYPSPSERPRDFQNYLIERAQAGTYSVLLPMTDMTSTLIAEIRDDLGEHVTVAMPDGASFLRSSDKGELMRLAESAGVPIPRTWYLEELSQVTEIARETAYPAVIKPCRSRVLTERGWVTGGIRYAYSHDDLIEQYHRVHEQSPFPMIQERITGPGVGLFLLMSDGAVKAAFAHRRLREKPPSGGVSVLREAIAVDPTALEHSVALLRALDWQGVAMVEFKQDNRDGALRLMEVNGRFWGSLQLAIDAGVDFPYLYYRVLNGETVTPVDSYTLGVRTRWLMGDVDHLLITWLHSRRSIALPDGHPGRLQTLWQFISTFFDGTRPEIRHGDDPEPARFERNAWWHDFRSGMRRRLG